MEVDDKQIKELSKHTVVDAPTISSKVSVIIPSRNEIFLNKTIGGLLASAKGDIEIIAVLDGYWPSETKRSSWSTPVTIEDPRVIYLHLGKVVGMRKAINAGVAISRGEFVMKCDAHCLFDEGFDVKLSSDCAENWVIIPRRYSLDAENWKRDDNRPVRDYHYLCYPEPGKEHDEGMHGVEWLERGSERLDPKYDIDDTMSFQGSCWFMHKTWFNEFLKGMDENEIYGGWAQEPTEIGNKTWLGGGEVKVNKKTWYAHLHKGKAYGRGFKWDEKQIIEGHNYAANYWMNNLWAERIHDIDWLVDKFKPVPTWPDNWKELYYKKI